ncbi:hypothetical protein NC797_06755 [Aquibacillus sp. 3ASR75-11]|uniref:Uncharacterized protein n=1 Tax=Terrihalobacillus insolitus TaxID=2950438 RepID=A0A9X4ALB9_9BACI|nr:hypothetical protein [Terrihalobacillus insolitus]MDC3414680.1 hypothetical protein [Terrihalobacillus insolitus]MDC3424207.1 hypothetical protein [Terrihalobacillus insolitus]
MKFFKLTIFLIVVSLLLIGCTESSDEIKIEGLKLDTVISSIKEQGIQLELISQENNSGDSIFQEKLNGIEPTTYSTSSGRLYIYVFPSEGSLEEGIRQFEQKTADLELILHGQYQVKNILIFYHDLEANNNKERFRKIDNKIRQAVSVLKNYDKEEAP